ncbi:efflux RND transporter periplasmic adaptor subunit [Paenibacillus apis]|uniref:MexH family multidrug efflux RND transporter periplasmic adaptor subunit n=1 Tax=Paenibacillus apis TaxID=1792174 RepID=A0A920CKZ5_9BACL|nr:efflux RND transporter periplasmic adaptor subunit [Paenibacillus apis]GIO44471.1 MexH family multidrug efflux RND transporter periplasmic adaptor subunit [Paenibacillus apis]
MNRTKWNKLVIGCVLLALGSIAIAGCTQSESPETEAQQIVQTPSVKISQADVRSIGEPQETIALVISSEERDIVVKASGEVLESLKKRGDQITKGELLFELDPTDVKLQQQKAQIALRTAQQSLKDANFANQNDPEALQPLKDQIQLAQIDMQQLERTLKNYKVTAPISGVLTDFSVESGMTVSQGIVGKIQQINPIKLTASITEENRKLIEGKEELAFYAPDMPGQLYTGKIVYLADIMDTQLRTYTLELQSDNAKLALKPGTKVQLRLTDEVEQEVLTIPTTAIIREESNTFVFTFADGKVEKRHVQLGRLNGMYQEVTDGLKQDEQVVVSGQHQLKDQQAVNAVPAK